MADLTDLIKRYAKFEIAIAVAVFAAALALLVYWSGEQERRIRATCTLTEESAPVGIAWTVHAAHRFNCPDGTDGWARLK